MRQFEHALVNIDALLRSGSATLADMVYLIVYLRDSSDFPRISEYCNSHFPDLPAIIVQGAVCRPAWLVEAEGVAITGNNDPAFPLF